MSSTRPSPQFNSYRAFPAGYEAMRALERAVAAGPIDPSLFELVKLRASQINGCGYCVDMHHKDARAGGESEERLAMLCVWRETPLFTDAERAALALTEAMTLIANDHVPPAVEAEAREQFDDETYAALIFTVATINAWNRIAITSHTEPGRYQPKAAAQ